ncbi:MAG: DUF4129 domain-containing protein [Sulfobacillus sp.]
MRRPAVALLLVLRTAVEAAALTPWAAVFTGALVPLWLLWAVALVLLVPGLVWRGAPLQSRILTLVLGGLIGLGLGAEHAVGLVTQVAPAITFLALGWRSATTAAYPEDPQQIQAAFTASIWIFFLGFVVSLLHQPPSPLSLAGSALVIAVAGSACLILARDRELAQRTALSAGRMGFSPLASFGLLTVAALTALSLILSLLSSPATIFRLLQPVAAALINGFLTAMDKVGVPFLGFLFATAERVLHIPKSFVPPYHPPSNLNNQMHRTYLATRFGMQAETVIVIVLVVAVVVALIVLLRHLNGRLQTREQGETEERSHFQMEAEAADSADRDAAYPYTPAGSRLRRSVRAMLRELTSRQIGPHSSETMREWAAEHRTDPDVEKLISNYETHRYGQGEDPADAEGLVARAKQRILSRRLGRRADKPDDPGSGGG